MPDAKIAPTVAEAQVGDLLWLMDPTAPRYDADGKYQGRGDWRLIDATTVGRMSVEVATYRSGTKFDRKTGAMRGSSGYNNVPYLCGAKERTARWWAGQVYAIARKVERCRDEETLKTIAFALGIEGPPDFSKAPAEMEATNA
jgi:hypothetical protein